MLIKDIKKHLQFGEKKTLFDVTECLQDMFDSYYDIDEDDFVIIMNILVKLCITFKDDHELFIQLMDTLELGVGRKGTEHIAFEPLIQLLHEKNPNRCGE